MGLGGSLPSSLYLIPRNSFTKILSHLTSPSRILDGGEPHSVEPASRRRRSAAKPELDDASRDARGASERASNQPPTVMVADVEEKEEAAEKGGGGGGGGGSGSRRASSSGPACVNVP